MRILHVCTGFDRASGITAFCFNVAREQAALGHDVSIVYSRTCDLPAPDGVRLMRAQSVGETGLGLDLVHLHGLWSWLSVGTMWWCWRRRVPFVVSPHGGLMPRVFTKTRVRKWVAWHFLLRPLMQRALLIHCTGESERDACLRLGVRPPCVIAPLGCRLPDLAAAAPRRSRTVLFLGRLDEEKGLVKLLSAWHRCPHEGWTLKLAGPNWRNHKVVLERQIADEGIAGVDFCGQADEPMKDALYREAAFFVLPSPMENFSMVVLEALSYGLPVIATKGTPWPILQTERCGWWIDQGVDALVRALGEAMSLSPESLRALGLNGRAHVERRYHWRTIVQELMRQIASAML